MTAQKIIYGTAWKQERTTALVVAAVLSGYRAIDTACQPRHYREDLVGEAVQILNDQHGIKREDLYIQTKFTPINGQDRKQPIPYDPAANIDTQIRESLQKSLSNLRTAYIDSLLLHSPLENLSRTIKAWKTLVSLQDSGKVKHIGVSNTYDVSVLEALEQKGGRRVQIVQNRWFEGNQWDNQVWKYCQAHGIQYQSFWTLSGSPSLLSNPSLLAVSDKLGFTPAQGVFKLAQSLGVTPLTGTTDEKHMREDLNAVKSETKDNDEDVKKVLAFIGV